MDVRYICLECGRVFDEPKQYTESTPGGLYHYPACPSCGGSYRPARQCWVCMEWENEEKCDYIDDAYICEECQQEVEEID